MITASHISAYVQNGNHLVIEGSDVTIDFTLIDDTATLNLEHLDAFFAQDCVNASKSERAEIVSYLTSVAEGNA